MRHFQPHKPRFHYAIFLFAWIPSHTDCSPATLHKITWNRGAIWGWKFASAPSGQCTVHDKWMATYHFLRVRVVHEEDVLRDTQHCGKLCHGGVVQQVWVDGGADELGHFGPHAVLRAEGHAVHAVLYQPLEEGHV